MKYAIFAKYHKNKSFLSARTTIKRLLLHGATPIPYQVIHEHLCSHECLVRTFEEGSIATINTLFHLGQESVADNDGVWYCIKLSSPEGSLLIYTAGSSDILYYSII